MIKCVIFDFDGTLVQSNEIKYKTFYEVTKHLPGANKLLDKLLSKDSGDRYSIFEKLINKLNIVDEGITLSKLTEAYTSICEKKITLANEIDGASDTIKALRSRGIKVFVSSATPKYPLEKIIEARGWKYLFDEVFGSPQSKYEHIQIITKKYQITVSDLVYVGDNEIDRHVSYLSGCRFIGIGENASRFMVKPDIILSSLKEFINTLRL